MTFRLIASRLWFGWTLGWNAGVLASMWPAWMTALSVWPTTRTFSGWLKAWARIVLGGCGFRVASQGTLPDGPAVLVANHQAMLDIPALALGVDAPFVFVARSELRGLPLVGSILARSRCVFLDRQRGRGGLEEAAERLAEGDAVLFFPEGTRSYGGPMRRFHLGAFRLAAQVGVPVVPIAIDGAYTLLNERARTARPGVVTVRVGVPLPPSDDARALRADARAAIARLLR